MSDALETGPSRNYGDWCLQLVEYLHEDIFIEILSNSYIVPDRSENIRTLRTLDFLRIPHD